MLYSCKLCFCGREIFAIPSLDLLRMAEDNTTCRMYRASSSCQNVSLKYAVVFLVVVSCDNKQSRKQTQVLHTGYAVNQSFWMFKTPRTSVQSALNGNNTDNN